MSFYMPMFLLGAVAVLVVPLVLFVGPALLRKIGAHREHKRRTNRRY